MENQNLKSKRREDGVRVHTREELEDFYKYEVNLIKGEILSILGLSKDERKIPEEFKLFRRAMRNSSVSGIEITPFLLEAYSEIALKAFASLTATKCLVDYLWYFVFHLIDPKRMQITEEDRDVFIKCLDILKTMGELSLKSGNAQSARLVCKDLTRFGKIANLYKLEKEKRQIEIIFTEMRKFNKT